MVSDMSDDFTRDRDAEAPAEPALVARARTAPRRSMGGEDGR
jgi:hypothetical protein